MAKSLAAYQQERHRLRFAHEGSQYVPTIGVIRRVQALQYLGWTIPEIARRCGRSRNWLNNIIDREWVHKKNVDLIKAIYDELWDVEAPHSIGAARAKNLARKRSWSPPMDWDDDQIDELPSEPTYCYVVTVVGPDMEVIVGAFSTFRRAIKQVQPWYPGDLDDLQWLSWHGKGWRAELSLGNEATVMRCEVDGQPVRPGKGDPKPLPDNRPPVRYESMGSLGHG